jgi:hypothetical protein
MRATGAEPAHAGPAPVRGRIRTPEMSRASLNYPHRVPLAATEVGARLSTLTHREPYQVGFFLFLALNAVLFLRPAEIVPALDVLPIYELLILGTLVACRATVAEQLSLSSLVRYPVTLCAVGFLLAILLSHLARFDLYTAREMTLTFAKVLLYYLLLVGVVRSPGRLRSLLLTVLVFLVVVATLSLLRYHGIVDVFHLDQFVDAGRFDEESGERQAFVRLMSSGIFQDPNDFSLVLVTGILICVKFVLEQKGFLARLLYATPFIAAGALLMYALMRTYSRGGFLALMSGLATLFVSRFGVKRAIPLVIVVIPILMVAVGGRQTSIDFTDDEDTAVGRVQVWYDGMYELRASPLFGMGAGQMSEVLRIVAHNSFVHSYVETGFLGGTLFLAMFYLPIATLWRMRHPDVQEQMHPALREWRPYVLAMLVAYAVGLCSLSRSYVVSTYLIVGIGAAFMALLARDLPTRVPAVTPGLAGRMAVISASTLVAFYVFTKVVL